MRTATLTEVRNESKRTGKSFEQIFKEQTGREVRKPEFRTQPSFVKRALTTAKSWFSPSAEEDAENRRTLAALGNRIAQEKRRDDLRRRLYPTREELEQERNAKRVRENLAEARRIGRELLGE
jgi:hypothetical protein